MRPTTPATTTTPLGKTTKLMQPTTTGIPDTSTTSAIATPIGTTTKSMQPTTIGMPDTGTAASAIATPIGTTTKSMQPTTTEMPDTDTTASAITTATYTTTSAMNMDDTTTCAQVDSLSAFENCASVFPANPTLGIINNSVLVSYLFEHKNREEDFQFNREGDLTLTIPNDFFESGLYNGTGYLTVVIRKTPNDDTEYRGTDSDKVYHILGNTLVSINLFSINTTLIKHEDEYNPFNITFPIKVNNNLL
ncbi:uncharacterized protein [Amphiura filiformis]|uniref:uncharacterized protein n=1 Tax=Amphiura filiformis TaxID=82378 RepID=UPI003B2171B3